MKKRILVIEDNDEVRDNLQEILDLYGYEVTTAEDGHSGAQTALQQPPDLSTYQYHQQLRSYLLAPDVPQWIVRSRLQPR